MNNRTRLGGFCLIDIHCHILPGVDDGAVNMEMSIAMARLAYEDGIRTVVATPHYNHAWKVVRERVIELTAALQKELDQREIPLHIVPGHEVRLENIPFVQKALADGEICYLDHNERFLLLEQAWEGYHPDTPDVLEMLRQRGTTMIIPHPERHVFFREQPQLLDRLIGLGAWTQVSVDSLIGNNGSEVQKFALQMLEREMIHTLATDAHNTRRRPNLSLGYALIEERAGVAAADAIRMRMKEIVPEPTMSTQPKNLQRP
jgi:protein-tyrosine phosphatase